MPQAVKSAPRNIKAAPQAARFQLEAFADERRGKRGKGKG